MRHGRKSRSTTINGFKRHIIIANRIILGGAVEPANQDEGRPTGRLLEAAKGHGQIEAAQFDRGYLRAPEVAELWKAGVELGTRTYASADIGIIPKEDFELLLDDGLVICPAGQFGRISPKTNNAYFPSSECQKCQLKPQCTRADRRVVHIHENERMLMEIRAKMATGRGRRAYRERTTVEHRLGRIDAIQGPKARYRGVRKNELDLRRAAAVANLQEVALWRKAA